MNRRDASSDDPQLALNHVHDGREAVGRARRRGHDVIDRGVVLVVVDAVHDVEHRVGRVLHGRGDEHFFDACDAIVLLVEGIHASGIRTFDWWISIPRVKA